MAAACLTWPLAAPAAWASLFGALPPQVFFYLLTAFVWAAGWTAIATAARPHASAHLPTALRQALPAAPLAAAVGGVTIALWGLSGWWATLLAPIWWLGTLAAVVVWWDAAILLLCAIVVIRADARGADPIAAVRATPHREFAVQGAGAALAAAAAWYLVRLYIHVWAPEPLIAPWAAWALLATAAALALKVILAPAETEGGQESDLDRPLPTGRLLTAGRVGAGAAYVVCVALLLALRPQVRAAYFRAPAQRDLVIATLSVHNAAGAEAAARRAAAFAAGADALRLAGAGAVQPAAQLASASVRLDPTASTGQLAVGLSDLAGGHPSAALQAAQALASSGAAGRGAYLAALACPAAKAPRGCRATAAAQALWADPRLAYLGPAVPKSSPSAPTSAPADPLLNRAVEDWAAAIGAPMPQSQWQDAARARAAWQLLSTYTGALPGLDTAARTQIALSGAMTAAAVGDGGGVQNALAGLDPHISMSVATAQTLLEAGALYESVAPDLTAGAVSTPLPPAVAQAALAAARAQGAPAALLLEAAEYSVLSANNYAGTNVTGEQAAIALLDRYTARDGGTPVAWDYLALAHYELGQFPQAQQAASRALALDHRDLQAQELIGDSLYGAAQAAGISATARTADLTSAAAHLRAAVQINPAPFLVWMALGDVLDASHQPAQALAAYQQAQTWLRYDLVNHVETFSAPHEGWGVTGLPNGGGGGPGVLQGDISRVQQELKTGAH